MRKRIKDIAKDFGYIRAENFPEALNFKTVQSYKEKCL